MLNWFLKSKQFNFTMIDQGIVSASNFLLTVLLASNLGISDFGKFSLVWMIVLFVQSLQHSVVIAAMLSIGSQVRNGRKPSYYGAVFVHQAVFSLVSVTFTFFCVYVADYFFSDWGVTDFIIPLLFLLFTSQWQDFLRRYFFSVGRPVSSVISDLIRYPVQIIILYAWPYVAHQPLDIPHVLWIMAGTSFAATVFFWSSFKVLKQSTLTRKHVLLRHWRFSKWLIVSTPLLWLSGNFLIIVAGGVLGTTAVGALKATQNLLGVTHVFFQGLENLVPINAAKKYIKAGRGGLKKYIMDVTWMGLLTTAIITVPFAIDPGFWLALLYGGDFEGYEVVLQLYIVVYLLTYLGLPPRFGLRALEKTFSIFGSYVISALLTVTTSYYIVNTYGLVGVLFGLISLQFVSLCFIWSSLFKELKIDGG